DLAFTPDGSTLIVLAGGALSLRDSRSGQETRRLSEGKVEEHHITGFALARDGTQLVACSQDRLLMFDLRAVSAEARTLVVKREVDGHTFTEVMSWGVAEAVGAIVHDGSMKAVSFSADGTRIATAAFTGSVKVRDAETGHELFELRDRPLDEAVSCAF